MKKRVGIIFALFLISLIYFIAIFTNIVRKRLYREENERLNQKIKEIQQNKQKFARRKQFKKTEEEEQREREREQRERENNNNHKNNHKESFIEEETETENDWKTTDGFIILQYPHTIDSSLDVLSKRRKLERMVLSQLPEGYYFLDYYYYIKGCSLSTFHRDVTSGQRYHKTIYPTYTVILYEYGGDLLSLCPESHMEYPFTWGMPIDIVGDKNTVVIFNSEILHCGMINRVGNERKVLQFKVAHILDSTKLRELEGIHVEKEGKCDLSEITENTMRNISYFFSFWINYVFSDLLQKKYMDGGIMNLLQDTIPVEFYNNV
jgi:hypothetical protein